MTTIDYDYALLTQGQRDLRAAIQSGVQQAATLRRDGKLEEAKALDAAVADMTGASGAPEDATAAGASTTPDAVGSAGWIRDISDRCAILHRPDLPVHLVARRIPSHALGSVIGDAIAAASSFEIDGHQPTSAGSPILSAEYAENLFARRSRQPKVGPDAYQEEEQP